jgi:hypothetical protein
MLNGGRETLGPSPTKMVQLVERDARCATELIVSLNCLVSDHHEEHKSQIADRANR